VLSPSAQPSPADQAVLGPGNIGFGAGTGQGGIGPVGIGDFQGGVSGGDVLGRGVLGNTGFSALGPGVGGAAGGIQLDTSSVTGGNFAAPQSSPPPFQLGGTDITPVPTMPGPSQTLAELESHFTEGGGGVMDNLIGQIASGQFTQQQGQSILDMVHQQVQQWGDILPPGDPRWAELMQMLQQQATQQIVGTSPQIQLGGAMTPAQQQVWFSQHPEVQ